MARAAAPAYGQKASSTLVSRLLLWYKRCGRDLPWRKTKLPYRILVSEVMLQQTQVDRVLPYYRNFLAQFPDERALAAASTEALHRAWKGLGYPSRADRLQAACRQILADHGGQWPGTVDDLRNLPGLGPYTSSAVACFAYAQRVAVVDTNIARVLARRDGLRLPIDRAALDRHAAALLPRTGKACVAYHNALMDLGATVCMARNPRCDACPWRANCKAAGNAARLLATANPLRVGAGPAKAAPISAADRALPTTHIVLGLIHHDGQYLVARRQQGAHQGGKWELPGGKREADETDRIALARELREELGVEVLSARGWLDFHHVYDGRLLRFHCYRCRLFDPQRARPLASQALRWVSPQQFMQLEFPPANAPLLARFKAYHRLG